MVEYDLPQVKDIQDGIDKEDLYVGESEEDKEKYGFESEPHVTILYGLEPDIEVETVASFLQPLKNYAAIFPSLTLFECEKYDVLKLDAKCDALNETHYELCKNLPNHDEHPEYHPHLTIAYLKKGRGEKYKQDMLSKIVSAEPTNFRYSFGETDEVVIFGDEDFSDEEGDTVSESQQLPLFHDPESDSYYDRKEKKEQERAKKDARNKELRDKRKAKRDAEEKEFSYHLNRARSNDMFDGSPSEEERAESEKYIQTHNKKKKKVEKLLVDLTKCPYLCL